MPMIASDTEESQDNTEEGTEDDIKANNRDDSPRDAQLKIESVDASQGHSSESKPMHGYHNDSKSDHSQAVQRSDNQRGDENSRIDDESKNNRLQNPHELLFNRTPDKNALRSDIEEQPWKSDHHAWSVSEHKNRRQSAQRNIGTNW